MSLLAWLTTSLSVLISVFLISSNEGLPAFSASYLLAILCKISSFFLLSLLSFLPACPSSSKYDVTQTESITFSLLPIFLQVQSITMLESRPWLVLMVLLRVGYCTFLMGVVVLLEHLRPVGEMEIMRWVLFFIIFKFNKSTSIINLWLWEIQPMRLSENYQHFIRLFSFSLFRTPAAENSSLLILSLISLIFILLVFLGVTADFCNELSQSQEFQLLLFQSLICFICILIWLVCAYFKLSILRSTLSFFSLTWPILCWTRLILSRKCSFCNQICSTNLFLPPSRQALKLRFVRQKISDSQFYSLLSLLLDYFSRFIWISLNTRVLGDWLPLKS